MKLKYLFSFLNPKNWKSRKDVFKNIEKNIFFYKINREKWNLNENADLGWSHLDIITFIFM